MALAALALIPALALAAPPPTPRRIAPLLIPMDLAAEAQVPKLEGYVVRTLGEYEGLEVKTPLAVVPDDEAEAAFRRAEAGYTEGRTAFDASKLEDAARSLLAAVGEYEKAIAAMPRCAKYCDALAMVAAIHFDRGELEQARDRLLALGALDPTHELGSKRFAADFIKFRMQVATRREANLRGAASLTSSPRGARVFVDGDFVGFTPLTLAPLPAGRHLLKLERPGFVTHGELLAISPDDSEVRITLKPGATYAALESKLDALAAELVADRPGKEMAAFGRAHNLDRAIVGTLKGLGNGGTLELIVGLYSVRGVPQRLAGKKVVFQGDEYGQLEREVTRVVTQLMNGPGSTDRATRSADPLEGRSGMEDWSGDDRSSTSTGTRRKPSSDPLDAVSGMEDW